MYYSDKIKKDVVNRKAGKSVQKRAKPRRLGRAGKAANVAIGRKRRTGKF